MTDHTGPTDDDDEDAWRVWSSTFPETVELSDSLALARLLADLERWQAGEQP